MTSDGQPLLWRCSSREHVDSAGLSGDVAADLVVIGGGFTGCSATLEAARSGARVALLEARTIGHGGSGRNVGLVNAGLWLPPDEVIKAAGSAAGPRLIEALSEGPSQVFNLIEREGIDCEAARNGTLHLAHALSGLRNLKNRFEQGTRFGAPLQLIDAGETERRTGTSAFHGALFDPRAGTIQPLAYCRGLARAAIRAGANIYEDTPVSSIHRAGGVWVVTAKGHAVRAKALLIATNAYHENIVGGIRPAFVAVNFSQFATTSLPRKLRERILPGGEGCWDTALVMSSLRVDRDGRLIIGGIGNAEGPGARVHAGWARRTLRRLYPEIGDLPFEYAWSGRIAMTSDHVPKVVRFGPSALAPFGYSGRGIAPGTLFGTRAAKALLEDRPEALPLPVIEGHREYFTGLRGACYEFGATLAHAMQPNTFSKPRQTGFGGNSDQV